MNPFEILSSGLPAIAALTAVLFAAGITKGVLGIGLPIVAVPLMSLVVPMPTAVALVSLPILITNLAQARSGEPARQVLQALLPLLLAMVIGVLLGVQVLTGLDPQRLRLVVGAVLTGVALLMLLAPKLHCPPQARAVAAPLAGLAGGVLGGLAGQPGPIVFIYLLAAGYSGSRFVQYSSAYLVVASLTLFLALGQAGAMGGPEAGLSLLCVLPILAGMRLGARLRNRLPEQVFRRLVLGIVMMSGVYLFLPALLASSTGPAQAAHGLAALASPCKDCITSLPQAPSGR